MVRIPEKNFLRAWREYRRMTQSQLAESVGTTGAVISLLESGQRGLNDKWLRRLAPVLGTTPGHILEFEPAEVANDVLEIWNDIPEATRPQVREIKKTFRDRGPNVESFPERPKKPGSDEPQQSKSPRRGKGPKEV